jgi:hypothetical protein
MAGSEGTSRRVAPPVWPGPDASAGTTGPEVRPAVACRDPQAAEPSAGAGAARAGRPRATPDWGRPRTQGPSRAGTRIHTATPQPDAAAGADPLLPRNPLGRACWRRSGNDVAREFPEHGSPSPPRPLAAASADLSARVDPPLRVFQGTCFTWNNRPREREIPQFGRSPTRRRPPATGRRPRAALDGGARSPLHAPSPSCPQSRAIDPGRKLPAKT